MDYGRGSKLPENGLISSVILPISHNSASVNLNSAERLQEIRNPFSDAEYCRNE